MKNKWFKFFEILIVVLLTACSSSSLTPMTMRPTASQTGSPTGTAIPILPTSTPMPSSTATPTPKPTWTATPTPAVTYALDSYQNEILFSVPVGDNGIHYQDQGANATPFGPTAFTESADRSFWFLDPDGGQVLKFSYTGEYQASFKLPATIGHAADLEVTRYGLVILDDTYQSPKIMVFSAQGDLTASYDLPSSIQMSGWVSGISTAENGDLLLEQVYGHGQYYVTPFLDPAGQPLATLKTTQLEHAGTTFLIGSATGLDIVPGHGSITYGDVQVDIETTNALGGVELVGFGPDGDFYVTLFEQAPAAIPMHWDEDDTVRHYDASGNLLGMARVPVSNQYAYIPHHLFLGPDGAVYALASYPDWVDVVRLVFVPDLKPILGTVIPTATPGTPHFLTPVPTLSQTRTPFMTPTFVYAAEKQAAVQLLAPYLGDLPFLDQALPSTLSHEYDGCIGAKDAIGILDYRVEPGYETVQATFGQYFQSKGMVTSGWTMGAHLVARSSASSQDRPLILYRVDVIPQDGQPETSAIYLGVYVIYDPSAFQELDNLDEAFANYCSQGVWLWIGP